jgi:tetratricopeptide (TPR) repeat protein
MSTQGQLLDLATEYHATGNGALAEQFAKSFLEEEPNHAEALHLLGLIAQQKGELQEAMAYLNRSLTADGSQGLVWQHAGELLFAGGDLAGGITYYEQALRLRPDHAEGYNTLGIALMRVGQWARAAECFQQATRLAPSFATALNNLGTVQSYQGKWAEAASAFAQALELWPDNPESAYNLGNARFYQGDIPAATACYRRALGLKPRNAPEVETSLATALRRQGKFAEAIAHYQEAMRLRPGHATALYNLSELAAEGRYAFPPELLVCLKEALASGRCGEDGRRLYAFAVAHLLDHQGAFDEAFSYYEEANELLRGLLKKQRADFHTLDYLAHVERMIGDQGAPYFQKVAEWGGPADLPVFIVGLPGSGAALVQAMLARHPGVVEVGDVGSVARFLAQSVVNKARAASAAEFFPDKEAARSAAAGYFEHLTQLGPGAARVVVNSLDNALCLGMIATLFSGVRVISCRRDLRDVALSCYFANRTDLPFACSLEDLAAFCLAHDRLMAHWARVLSLTIHEVDFESLVREPEEAARALTAYCGLDRDERCGIPPTAPGAGYSIGRWRHYHAHLGPFLKALQG